MFIPRIYFPIPLASGNTVLTNEKIAHYLINVLRLQSADNIIVFNGENGEYTAQLLIEKKKVSLEIKNFINVDRRSPIEIHLGQGLARGDRMDFVIQKATELGVTHITPLFTKHCAVKLDEARSQKRMTHWLNIAVSASEQCGRTDIPIIHLPLSLQDWAKQSFSGPSLVFEIGDHTSLKLLSPSKTMRLGIGPESGWDESETDFMISQGFIPCRLGPRILRAETASITAVSLLQGFFGDLA